MRKLWYGKAALGITLLIAVGTTSWFSITPSGTRGEGGALCITDQSSHALVRLPSPERAVFRSGSPRKAPVPVASVSETQPKSVSVEAEPEAPQSLDDFLEKATREGFLSGQALTRFRRASIDSLRACRELASAGRIVTRSADTAALVYDFVPLPERAAELDSQIVTSIADCVTSDVAAALISMLSEASESDPSLDLLRHRRQIIIQTTDSEGHWQLSDRTFDSEGNVLATNTVFLGFDDNGQIVWPDEYVTLLGE